MSVCACVDRSHRDESQRCWLTENQKGNFKLTLSTALIAESGWTKPYVERSPVYPTVLKAESGLSGSEPHKITTGTRPGAGSLELGATSGGERHVQERMQPDPSL